MGKEEIMLAEYQASQSSAEHYNTMTWTLLSIVLAFSLLILKTILLDINSAGWQFTMISKYSVINGILLIGTISWMYFGYLIEGANQKKLWKYYICKKIEKSNKLFLGQNIGTSELAFSKKEWGSKLFILIKNIFIILFLSLSFLVYIKSVNTSQMDFLFYPIISIHLILVILNTFYELNFKKRLNYPEKILLDIKKIQEN